MLWYSKNLLNESVLWAPKHMFKLIAKSIFTVLFLFLYTYMDKNLQNNIHQFESYSGPQGRVFTLIFLHT